MTGRSRVATVLLSLSLSLSLSSASMAATVQPHSQKFKDCVADWHVYKKQKHVIPGTGDAVYRAFMHGCLAVPAQTSIPSTELELTSPPTHSKVKKPIQFH
jgi:hypothetical protein